MRMQSAFLKQILLGRPVLTAGVTPEPLAPRGSRFAMLLGYTGLCITHIWIVELPEMDFDVSTRISRLCMLKMPAAQTCLGCLLFRIRSAYSADLGTSTCTVRVSIIISIMSVIIL